MTPLPSHISIPATGMQTENSFSRVTIDTTSKLAQEVLYFAGATPVTRKEYNLLRRQHEKENSRCLISTNHITRVKADGSTESMCVRVDSYHGFYQIG